MSVSLTIGIEEEYQTIDPETRGLRSHVQTQILEQGKVLLQEDGIKPEMHQSIVEIGSPALPRYRWSPVTGPQLAADIEAKDQVKRT